MQLRPGFWWPWGTMWFPPQESGSRGRKIRRPVVRIHPPLPEGHPWLGAFLLMRGTPQDWDYYGAGYELVFWTYHPAASGSDLLHCREGTPATLLQPWLCAECP
jgi:hypothetical protein